MTRWEETQDRMAKTFVFATFADAISFMVRVSYKAEEMNHHPEWKNIYNKVFVELTTHDAGGVTVLDKELSTFMDAVYDSFH